MQVTVLGAGSWGTTVASLTANRNPTLLWARDEAVAEEITREHTNKSYLPGFDLPTRLRATADLEEAVTHAELLIVGVPTRGFRGVLEQAKPYVHPWIPVISLSKGFEAGTLLRMTEVIGQVLPGRPAVALSGPNLAREIMSGQAAASVVATEDISVATAIQGALARGVFRIYTNHDVIGAEVGGALKNVIALATGMAEGLGVGDNTRATVIARGLAEITRLGVAMGGEPATFAGLAGLGDLVATCMSPLSATARRGGARQGPRARRDPLEHEHGRRGREDREHRDGARRSLRHPDADRRRHREGRRRQGDGGRRVHRPAESQARPRERPRVGARFLGVSHSRRGSSTKRTSQWSDGAVAFDGDALHTAVLASEVRHCVVLGAPVVPLGDAAGLPAEAALELGHRRLPVQHVEHML